MIIYERLRDALTPTNWRLSVATALRVVLIAIALLLPAMCLGVRMSEHDFIYRPETERKPPDASNLAGVREQILPTPDGERLVVWRVDARPGQPTLLYFCGNGELLGYRAERIREFQAQGYGVYMLAWRGYSGSTGRPSETANVADAALAYDHLRGDGIEARDIIVYGESLGASVAVFTAIARPVRAVILEAPFSSMVATWRQFVPFLPVGLLLRDKYETIKAVGRLAAPLLVMHGQRDRLVWFEQGRRLFEAAPPPKRFVGFSDAGHKDLYDHGAIAAVHDFIRDVRAGGDVAGDEVR